MARERKFSTEELFKATEQLLFQHGYEGFTFGILAEHLEISRTALYKYYENKDELITDYMIYEMQQFLLELKKIGEYPNFEDQFDFLLEVIFRKNEIHQLISIANQIRVNSSGKVIGKLKKLDALHLDMYKELQNFIQLGKNEGLLKTNIPAPLMLGFIFQTIAIPNHFEIPKSQWTQSMKEIICFGMFADNKIDTSQVLTDNK